MLAIVYLAFSSLTAFAQAFIMDGPSTSHTCRATKDTRVIVLGAGIAGIGAAKELAANGMHEFMIIEHNDYIGGRMVHADFGTTPNGASYSVELGANWVHGRYNSIWPLVKEYNLNYINDDNPNVAEFDKDGPATYLKSVREDFQKAQKKAGELATYMLDHDSEDISVRAGLRYSGWNPDLNPHQRLVEWYDFTYHYGVFPDDTSFLDQLGDSESDTEGDVNDTLILDPRGYNTIVREQAREFLAPGDSRLRLNSTVVEIAHSRAGVTVHTSDGSCVKADYAICTFSIGVLQSGKVKFSPELPKAKRLAIASMNMAVYDKIFLQFDETFWSEDKEALLYADDTRNGFHPVWQSLSGKDYLSGSNIIFSTVIGEEAKRIERQSNAATQTEMMEVLRAMFPDKFVPEPVAMLKTRWNQQPWVCGSFSNTPVGFGEDMWEALRQNVSRLWFAGEALAEEQSTVQGAWDNGREVGIEIASLM